MITMKELKLGGGFRLIKKSVTSSIRFDRRFIDLSHQTSEYFGLKTHGARLVPIERNDAERALF